MLADAIPGVLCMMRSLIRSSSDLVRASGAGFREPGSSEVARHSKSRNNNIAHARATACRLTRDIRMDRPHTRVTSPLATSILRPCCCSYPCPCRMLLPCSNHATAAREGAENIPRTFLFQNSPGWPSNSRPISLSHRTHASLQPVVFFFHS